MLKKKKNAYPIWHKNLIRFEKFFLDACRKNADFLKNAHFLKKQFLSKKSRQSFWSSVLQRFSGICEKISFSTISEKLNFIFEASFSKCDAPFFFVSFFSKKLFSLAKNVQNRKKTVFFILFFLVKFLYCKDKNREK